MYLQLPRRPPNQSSAVSCLAQGLLGAEEYKVDILYYQKDGERDSWARGTWLASSRFAPDDLVNLRTMVLDKSYPLSLDLSFLTGRGQQ